MPALWLLLAASSLLAQSVEPVPQADEVVADSTSEKLIEGLWPSPKLQTLMLQRWAEEAAEQYDLDPEQRAEVRKRVVERWTGFLDDNRALIQPLLNEFIEMRMELEPPAKEHVEAWAQRALPMFEMGREQIQQSHLEFREVLRPVQRISFEVDALKMQAGMAIAEQKLQQWRKGEFDKDDFWEPLPTERRTRREERRRRRAAEEETAVKEQEPAPPVDPIAAELDRWETYVADFIALYGLDGGQRAAAQSCLSELRERASAHRERYREDINQLERQIESFNGDEATLNDLKDRLHDLYGPIDDLFKELQARLDAIPTASQRAAVVGSAAARPTPASERAENWQVRVDPRVELMSVIFRLAEFGEYARGRAQSYNDQVDSHFGKFKQHPVVQFARKLRSERGLGFDACMSLAVHVGDPDSLQPLAPLDSDGLLLEKRWTPESAGEFLEYARAFARESGFSEFFRAQGELYAVAVARMRDLLSRTAHWGWFEQYFGPKSAASFTVALAMLNGPSNYGVRFQAPGGPEDLYSIIGVVEVDESGAPEFESDETVALLVHEFTHSFVNHVVEHHRAELEAPGRALYAVVQEPMKKMAYGDWKIMLDELLVRAAAVRYVYIFQGPEAAERRVRVEEGKKFLWIRDAVDLLARYEAERERYPTFADFFPHVTAYLRENAPYLADRARDRMLQAKYPPPIHQAPPPPTPPSPPP